MPADRHAPRHVAGPGSGGARWLWLVPLAALAAGLAYGARSFHWDTLERAYLLEHAGRYLRSWDGTPRSQFFAFAHVLELPMAWVVGRILPGVSGMRTLVVFEALAAGVVLWSLGRLVRFWGGSLQACVVAQVTFAVSLAFWKMGSSGEEKVVALATQLLFLLSFWRTLESGRGAVWTGVTLAFAVLTHLTGVVLVPFAFAALRFVPAAWRGARPAVLRAVTAGTLAAGGIYAAVAAATTGVHSPRAFLDYLTFFHRAGGNNFFEMTGAAAAGSRPERIARGLGSFFAGDAWVQVLCAVLFLYALAVGFFAARRNRRRTLWIHAALAAAPWTVHFAFFEPQNHESWTLVAALLVLLLAAGLPAGRRGAAAFAFPALLVAANARHYVANHAPMAFEAYRRLAVRTASPEDLFVVTGGIQNERALRGGLVMRYYLAHERQHTVISLYDALGVTQPDFWPRPFVAPAQLQAAIDSGRRALVPGFLREELDRAVASGAFAIDYVPVKGDSLYEITRIASLPP